MGVYHKYRMETHLKQLCEEDEIYKNLYSSWNLNKKTYSKILMSIPINYPHYSLHDSTHSEKIINNIEMLLGESRIKKLSPTDTWLILNCAYLHDFGMVLLYSKIESEWENKEFQCFLKESKNSRDKDLKEAVEYLYALKDNLKESNFDCTWPLKIRSYVTNIISTYFRGKHSSLTREYLNKLDDWSIDLTQNGLIQRRLVKLIGEISFLHTQSFEEVMNLDYISNGYNSDYIHPRFLAELIRLGDLLDLDNGRFNDYIRKVAGKIPEVSDIHREKHESTTHILITSEKIEVRADCINEFVYREVRNWISFLEQEIKDITLNWTDIIPENFEWYAPRLTKKQLLLNGKPDSNNLTDLKFNISQKKAFEIIEGSNLYENKLTFIREFIQNALDATKIQLWNDLNEGVYNNFLNGISIYDCTPFDIPKEIYDNYKILIKIEPLDNEKVKLIITDNGTGISLDTLKKLCNVGESYSENKILQSMLDSIPSWLYPTGGFGIGIQSGFLITDSFVAYTKTPGMKTLEIKFESISSEGYISVRDSSKEMKRGTEFHIIFDEFKSFKYQLGSRVDEIFSGNYDPFQSKSITSFAIVDFIESNINNSLFPIEIEMNTEKIYLECFKVNEKFDEKKDNYLYFIKEDLSKVHLWNKKESVYMEIGIFNSCNSFMHSYQNISFRGCLLSKEKLRGFNGISLDIDIYGFDTKSTLKIDRTELTEDGKYKLYQIVDEGIRVYFDIIKSHLDNPVLAVQEYVLNVTNFLILYHKYIKEIDFRKYKNLISNDDFSTDLLIRNNNIFEYKKVGFDEIINDYPKVTYLDISKFKNNGENQSDVIRGLVNKYESQINANKIIIGGDDFIRIIQEFSIQSIQCIKSDVGIQLLIYTVKDKNINGIVKVDSDTRKYFIKKLVNIPKKNMGWSNKKPVRCFIPAIEGYEELGLDRIFNGIKGDYYNNLKIISPITKFDEEKIDDFDNVSDFINYIANRNDYKSLVEFTCENQLDKYSKEEISKKYQNLIKEYFEVYYSDKEKNNTD